MTSYRPLGRFLASIVDTVIDAPLLDNTSRLLDLLNGLNPEKLRRVLSRLDERGYTPLHVAAERNRPESLKCLLIKDANPNIRSSLTTSEVTPLHIAALHGHLACLQLLVQLGGDIMLQDKRHLTPVDYAQINGQDLCFNYLNEVIAQRQAEERTGVEDVLIEVERNLAIDNVQTLNHWKQLSELFPLSINTRDPSQLESIMYRHCIIINSRDVVRVLGRIAKDIPISLHGASLLHAACRYGRTELTRLLVQKVPEIMFSITNEAYNPLHVAVVHQHIDIVKILVQSQTTQPKGPSHEEPGRDRSLSESLRLQQARFGEPTMSGHTVLHLAVALKNTEILRVLLKHHRKIKVNYEASKCGYTALHLAVFLNHFECAKLLLKCGANPNASLNFSSPLAEDLSNISRSILSEAVINKNFNLLQLLIDYGGEDKGHSAIRICIPSAEHRTFLVPLLGSLIRLDDGLKVNKQASRKVKPGIAEWGSLKLTEIDPLWIHQAFCCSKFLKGQKVEAANACDHLSTIDLSGNQLSCLPQELFQLSGLQILNVSANCITGLPDLQQSYNEEKDSYEWTCKNLTRLNLSKNLLSDLPHFLFKIPSLSYLDVSNNQLLSLPFDLWSAPKLYHVIGSNNKLERIPTNWPEVMNVMHAFEHDPPGNGVQPKGGKEQRPKRKKFARDHKPHLASSSFECDRDKPLISKLQDCLNISNSNLPIEWGNDEGREEAYDGLGILNLSNNLIREIPDNLPCLCPKLIRLDLSHNRISYVSVPRQFPAGLKHLNLSHNLIETLNCRDNLSKPLPCTNPLLLAETGNLYHEDGSFCSHRQHFQLSRLSCLELNNCLLREVDLHSQATSHRRRKGRLGPENTPAQGGAQQPNSSRRADNPDHLVFPLLSRLLLSHNVLNQVPDSVCKMVSLTSLDLSHNDIIELPAKLGRLCNLWEFPLDGLNLISPPHNIIERGKTRDIIGFLWSLLQRARPYHRMKLMLVGKAARGKTTLLSRISERGQRGVQENWALIRMVGADKQKGNLSTVGIVVSDWTYYKRVRQSQTSLRNITFMTWDFGGQEEYYATHQCFISRRSLYLVVWNVTYGMVEVEELRPWLLNIQARAPNSPVIIVGTHIDKLSSRQMREECKPCLDHIARAYGTADNQRDGYPSIRRSMLVSCKSGRGINELREAVFDVASQVKENTVAGRGIGCGRIPDNRLLMDQLVPASYLQLEDTVRNLAIQMRTLHKAPVLTYKELRELVFADSRTLISQHSADRELEQAIRFLHDNGTLLHYEDPLLEDFYFVDPQWLCDMLAHIITVREINPFIKEGVMRIADFAHIFTDDDFPIRWRRVYIRLLTTFEVAVELSDGELLIPSALPPEKPNLPCPAFPHSVRMLPPLRHTYIIPFVPSGFWPRLMSRVLSDKTIIQLAKDGCSVFDSDIGQLGWVKWRQGLILQYGNLTLMTIEEIKDGLFPQSSVKSGLKFSHEGRWEAVRKNTKVSGISVTVPDMFPILKYLEHSQRKTDKTRRTSSLSDECPCPPQESLHQYKSQLLPAVPELHVEASSEISHDNSVRSRDSQTESHDSHVTSDVDHTSCANRVVEIDKIDEEVEKLAIKCKSRCRLFSWDTTGVAAPPVVSTASGSAVPSKDWAVSSTEGKYTLESRLNSFDGRFRAPSSDISCCCAPISTISGGSINSTADVPHQQELPVVDEETHDQMRAGLISKAVDHVTLLIEDWFTGVRPRHHLVPCPHCASSSDRGNRASRRKGPRQVHLLRSFSADTSLQLERSNEGELLTSGTHPSNDRQSGLLSGPAQGQPSSKDSVTSHKAVHKPLPLPAKQPSKFPWWQPSLHIRGKPTAPSAAKSHAPVPGKMHRGVGSGRYLEPEHDQENVSDPYNYAFRYDDCVVTARTQDYVTCPAHGKILLRYMSPDTLFLAQGKDILINSADCVEEGVLGQGAYATVFQVKIKRPGETEFSGPYALKTLTKEWSRKSSPDSSATSQATPPKPPSRYSIMLGFTNLKKELSILSPLKNDHIIRVHGVILCPLGLVLEHAPGGSLKRHLEQYHDMQHYLPGSVAQAVILQVAQAMQYLHSRSIIYRDLKSDNVLVWRFPVPQDSILIPPGRLGPETVLVKLSDLGISQFAATQGARGLVGTPGFMAPEILKYHGKEVYTDQVDIFSFGMFMYELVTQHIPYDTLTGQQANQANESGVRPALTRKDLRCAVLLRELMVWCWQQDPDKRPTADDIITTAESDQFLRLLNGIRISNGGQVTAACVTFGSMPPHLNLFHVNHRYSSRIATSPAPPIHTNLTNPFIFDRSGTYDTGFSTTEVEQESLEIHQPNRIISEHTGRWTGKSSRADSGIVDRSTEGACSTNNIDHEEGTSRAHSLTVGVAPIPNPPPAPSSRRLSVTQSSVPRPLSAPTVYPIQQLPEPLSTTHHTSTRHSAQTHLGSAQRSYSSDELSPTLYPPPSSTIDPHHLGAKSDRLSEPRMKTNLSPHSRWLDDRELNKTFYSPSSDSVFRFTEEEPSFEVWVASSDAHRSVLSVVGYNGQFNNLEEMDVGDSPVTSICSVGKRVWIGFQIGYLLIFDSASHHLVAQAWITQYTSIVSIVHVSDLRKVYITMENGSIFAYRDEVSSSEDAGRGSLCPVSEYHSLGQMANCVTAIPSVNGMSHELWVGQSEAWITVLDPSDLSVVKFIHNTSDVSPTPSYLAHLTYANLVYTTIFNDRGTVMGDSQAPTVEGGTQEEHTPSVSVYGALYHGQYVTQWNATSKEMITCYNCKQCIGNSEECKISSLHCHSLQLLVGLCSGKILVLEALSFHHLSTLNCHRAAVYSMNTLSLGSLAEPYFHSRFAQQWNSGSSNTKRKASRHSLPERHSIGSVSLSVGSQSNSTDPSPIPMSMAAYSTMELRHSSEQSITSSGSSDQNRMGTRLLSFGSGFKSYYDGPESLPHQGSGFLLVWDLHPSQDTS